MTGGKISRYPPTGRSMSANEWKSMKPTTALLRKFL